MSNRREFLKKTGVLLTALQTPLATAQLSEPEAATTKEKAAPTKEEAWLKLRGEFNLDYSYAHFAGFLITSHPKVVRDDIAYHRNCLDQNPAHYVHHEEIWKREEETRKSAAEYLGVKPSQIALTGSTTQGLGTVYNGLYMKPGQEVLTSVHDHYSTKGSLLWRSEKDNTPVKTITLFKDASTVSTDEVLTNIKNNITPKTRVLAFTWVHSGSGIKMPVAQVGKMINEINAQREPDDKIIFCVDGVHGLGIENVTFDELNCDYLIAGTHKWMFGPRGTGIICSRSEKLETIAPTFESFSTYANFGKAMTPGGYHAFEHQWALRKAFDFHLQLGKENIQNRIHFLNSYLKERLLAIKGIELVTPRSTEFSSGFTFFRVKGHKPDDVEKYLQTHKVIASATDRDVGPLLRMAPGLINTTEEIDRAARLLQQKIRQA